MALAGGKVILVGEHAVVYGVEAIAVGLAHGVRAVAVSAAAHERSTLTLDDRQLAADDLTYTAFLRLLTQLAAPACHVNVALEMPAGVGLGASAAIGVAVARAVSEQRGHPLSRPDLLAAVNAWEAVFHGNPSGIDAACSAVGGCIRFSKALGPRTLHLASPLQLAIAVAGPASSTKEMVARVAALNAGNPSRFQAALDEIADLVNDARVCLESGNVTRLGALINANHQLLAERWQLSTPAIERACQTARNAGALGAKVTGAGGGGCALAVCPDTGPEPVLEAWRRAGFNCFAARIEASERNG
jgi:mevalonate kinase